MKKRFASKALCMLLAFAMIMSLGFTVSAAANTIVAKRSAERISNGEQVTITISLKQAMEKFSGFNVTVKYSTDAFDFVSAQWESDEIAGAAFNAQKELPTPESVAISPSAVAAGFVFVRDNMFFENLSANYDLVSFTFQAKDGYGGKYSFDIIDRDFELGYNDGTQYISLRGNLEFEDTYVIIEGDRTPYILAVEDAYNTYNPDEYTKNNWAAITLIYTDALEAMYNSTIEADWREARDNAIADMGIIPKGGDEEDDSGDNSGDNSGNGNNNNTPQGPGTYIPQAPSGPVGGVVGGGTGGIGGGGGGTGGGGGGAPVVPDDNNGKETTSGGIVIDDTLVPGAIEGPEVTETQIAAVEALYTDMENHWASAYVYDLSLVRGIFKGNGDGTFAPDIGITRQEISVALGRLLGYDERAAAVKTTEYLDNETIADWARGYIAVMSEEKILLGDSDGNFYPEDIITREQLALILSRLVEKPQAVAAMKFNDVDKISEWAAEGCSISYTYGIIKGYPDNTFRGINEVTRSEAATMIYNYIQVTEDIENEELADEITDIAENAYN